MAKSCLSSHREGTKRQLDLMAFPVTPRHSLLQLHLKFPSFSFSFVSVAVRVCLSILSRFIHWRCELSFFSLERDLIEFSVAYFQRWVGQHPASINHHHRSGSSLFETRKSSTFTHITIFYHSIVLIDWTELAGRELGPVMGWKFKSRRRERANLFPFNFSSLPLKSRGKSGPGTDLFCCCFFSLLRHSFNVPMKCVQSLQSRWDWSFQPKRWKWAWKANSFWWYVELAWEIESQLKHDAYDQHSTTPPQTAPTCHMIEQLIWAFSYRLSKRTEIALVQSYYTLLFCNSVEKSVSTLR